MSELSTVSEITESDLGSELSIITDCSGQQLASEPSPSSQDISLFFNRHGSKRKRNEKLNQLFLLALVTGDVPFNFRENRFLCQFFDEIDVSYAPPKRRALKNELDKAFDNVKEDNHQKLANAATVAFEIDSWTNAIGQHVVNVVGLIPKPILLDTLQIGAEHTTGSYLFEKIVKPMIEKTGSTRVCAFVSDGGSNMIACADLVKAEYPHILFVRCYCHVINNLITDMLGIDRLNRCLSTARTIFSQIKKSTITCARWDELHESHGLLAGCSSQRHHSLALPTATRWYSHYELIKKVLKGKQVIRSLAAEDLIDNKGYLSNPASWFWNSCEHVRDLFGPLVEAIGMLERENSKLSDVYWSVTLFREKLDSVTASAVEKKALTKIMNHRCSDVYITDAHLSCYFLDHRHRSQPFNSMDKHRALAFICSYGETLGKCCQDTAC